MRPADALEVHKVLVPAPDFLLAAISRAEGLIEVEQVVFQIAHLPLWHEHVERVQLFPVGIIDERENNPQPPQLTPMTVIDCIVRVLWPCARKQERPLWLSR